MGWQILVKDTNGTYQLRPSILGTNFSTPPQVDYLGNSQIALSGMISLNSDVFKKYLSYDSQMLCGLEINPYYALIIDKLITGAGTYTIKCSIQTPMGEYAIDTALILNCWSANNPAYGNYKTLLPNYADNVNMTWANNSYYVMLCLLAKAILTNGAVPSWAQLALISTPMTTTTTTTTDTTTPTTTTPTSTTTTTPTTTTTDTTTPSPDSLLRQTTDLYNSCNDELKKIKAIPGGDLDLLKQKIDALTQDILAKTAKLDACIKSQSNDGFKILELQSDLADCKKALADATAKNTTLAAQLSGLGAVDKRAAELAAIIAQMQAAAALAEQKLRDADILSKNLDKDLKGTYDELKETALKLTASEADRTRLSTALALAEKPSNIKIEPMTVNVPSTLAITGPLELKVQGLPQSLVQPNRVYHESALDRAWEFIKEHKGPVAIAGTVLAGLWLMKRND